MTHALSLWLKNMVSPISRRRRSRWGPPVEMLELRTLPATFTVASLADAGSGSLRQAIQDANNHAGADTIDFQAGLTGTITLTTGQLSITDSVTINGPGTDKLAISGNNASRIFSFGGLGSQSYSVSGLTLPGGNGTGRRQQGFGGAIYLYDDFEGNDSLSLFNVRQQDNTADLGGAIFAVEGQLTVSSSFFLNNSATGTGPARGGGAIAIQESVAFVYDSTFTRPIHRTPIWRSASSRCGSDRSSVELWATGVLRICLTI